MGLTLTWFGHACVVLESDDRLVIDPGTFSDTTVALARADVVLLTHEHADHVDVPVVVASGLPVYAPAPVLAGLTRAGAASELLHPVAAGDRLTFGATSVRVLGEWHEVIHRDAPRFANVAYLVDDGAVLHPGDAYGGVPHGMEVDLALTPVSGPWVRASDVVDWLRVVRPQRIAPIHDALATTRGVGSLLQWVERLCEVEVLRPAAGEPLVLTEGR